MSTASTTYAAQPRNTVPVKVRITYDGKGLNLQLEGPEKGQVQPLDMRHPITLISTERSEVYWICNIEKSQRIEITFAPSDSPFRFSQFHLRKGAGCLSGIVAKEKARAQPYECTVKLLGSDPKSTTNQVVIANTKAYVVVK